MSAGEVQAVDHVAAMFPAIVRGDLDALKACFAPGAVIWHNNDEVEQDIDQTCEGLNYMLSVSNSLAYEDQTIVHVGNKCFVQHVLIAQLNSGETMRLPAMMHIETDSDGRVTRLDEYFDSRAIDCLKAS